MDRDKRLIKPLLTEMDDCFTRFFEWLAGQYDRNTGGFYYARSSISDERLSPDIESSAQAINILLRQQQLDAMPETMRRQMIRFFRKKQHPETGYFLDDDPNMKQDEVMVQRAIYYAAGSLEKLGSSPLFPLPAETIGNTDNITDMDAHLELWKSVELSNSWRGCDRLATACSKIIMLPERQRGPLVKAAERYLASIQDEETGLWGEGSLYVRISGTFKLHGFYRKFNLPMPRTDRIYDSILTCLKNEEAFDMCYIRNPIDLLSYIDAPIPPKQWLEIVEITIENMKKLKRGDGGFSRELTGSPPAPNVAQVKTGEYYPVMPAPVILGKGRIEGDMNASTQATLIRMMCYSISKVAEQPLPSANQFYQMINDT